MLDVVYDPFVDGAELAFEEQMGVSESEILRMIPPKENSRSLQFRTPAKSVILTTALRRS